METITGKHLEPRDWEAFRREMHRLVDVCVDHLRDAQSYPWQPVPSDVKESYSLQHCTKCSIYDTLVETVLPYHTGNSHPRFFGWAHGTGLASDLASELISATMNSNNAVGDHGMVYIERAVIDWAKTVFGFPSTASGVLVVGTSQATVLALSAARVRALGTSVRKQGNCDSRLVAYAGSGVHNSVKKAIELLGIGSDNLRLVPYVDPLKGMDITRLEQMIQSDIENGFKPFAIIGNVGSVDIGAFDDLIGLSEVSTKYGLWLHIDGAFGAWARISHDDTIRNLTNGIDRVDSIACDFHKWMYVHVDCGMVLMKNEKEHRSAFAARPPYLVGLETGLAGGDPWYCDYGIDLSRGARALRVWTALKSYGVDAFSKAITDNCRMARYMGDLIQKSTAQEQQLLPVAPSSEPTAVPPTEDTSCSASAARCKSRLQLAMPKVVSNVVVFTARSDLTSEEQGVVNKRIAAKLQLDGACVLSTTIVAGTCVLRAAITNHRTTFEDIDLVIAAVIQAAETG